MTRQNNNISDKISAKSLADLYEKAKVSWADDIQDMLESMIDGVKDINDWLLTAQEIDQLADQIADKKGSIKSSFAFQLRKNLNDFKNMRRTRSHKDMAQGWQATDSIAREGPEQNPELKSIIKQYTDEYLNMSETLFQRLQICVNRSDVKERENPVSVQNLCFSFRNSIGNLNLETKYEAALYRYFASKILSELTPGYQKIDDLLIKQGVLLDKQGASLESESENKPPEKSKSATAGPGPKPGKVNAKKPDNLSEQIPPESLVISRRFELLSLLHEEKKISQSTSSKVKNIFTDLREKLSEANITEFDREFDHVSFLFNFVFSNKDLPDETRSQLARLQTFVLLSAINESDFINQSNNPAQLLLDTVVKTEIELVDSGRGEQTGNQVLKTGIDQLIESQSVTSKNYAELLKQYNKHIDDLQRKIEQEEHRKKEEEVARLKKIDDENRRKRAEEEARQKIIDEEDRKNKANEEARQKIIEQEDRKKKAEEEARKKIIEQEDRKKKAEEEARKKIIDEEDRGRQAEEEARQKKIEEEDRKRWAEDETRKKKFVEENRKKRAEEESRLKKIEEERLKRVEEEKRLKRVEEEKRLNKIKEQERLKQNREKGLEKLRRAKEAKLEKDQTRKMRQHVKSTIEEISIPLLALNKPFILFDKVWSPLLLQIALTDGTKSQIWEKTLRMVRNQVWSLIPKSTVPELKKLIATRPHISNSLVRGMRSLKLSSGLQKSLTEYLKIEYQEVIKQSTDNIKAAGNSGPAKSTSQKPVQKVTANRPVSPINKIHAAKSTAKNNDSEDKFIHSTDDLFLDDDSSFTEDLGDLIIDDTDDDIIIEGSNDKIVQIPDDDTNIKESEDMIIEDIEDFSMSMKTGIYQLSSEMLKALNAVVPGKRNKASRPTEADEIKQGDWVEIKQGSNTVMGKLTWKAADNSLYIFVDNSGQRIKEIDGATLNSEIKSGSMKLVKSSSVTSAKSHFSVVKPPG